MADPTQTNISQTSIPDYAKPYVENLLGVAQATAFNTDANGNITGAKPYQTYPGERTADFTGLQNQAFTGAQNLGPASQIGTATDMAQQAGLGALNTQYNSSNYGNQYGYNPQNVQGSQANAAQNGAAPMSQAAQFQGAAPIGYQGVSNQGLNNYQMGPAQQVGTQQFTGDQVGQYMNPYLQNALQPALQEMQRQYAITGTQEAGNATKQGAFGGSRQALMQAENERNKNMGMNQMIGQGYNTAYQNAQQQFNTSQGQNLQAQQANQNAGLATGTQNLNALLGVQNLGAGQNMQAQLANQQAGLTANQFNATNAYNTGLQNAQLAQQSNLANQSLQGQYGLANTGYQQAANLQNAQLAQQANLANQQAGLTSAQTSAQYGQAANQLNEQSQQYGAGLGLQGLQTALQGAGALGNLGATNFNQNAEAIGLQGQMGGVQQQQQQNVLNQQYQDFLNQKQYPYQQVGFMSDMLRGLPLSQSTTSMYSNPSMLSQVAGLGTAAAGAYGLAKKAKGGKIKEQQRPAGLAELALSKMG
jgi:hypothetical protein